MQFSAFLLQSIEKQHINEIILTPSYPSPSYSKSVTVGWEIRKVGEEGGGRKRDGVRDGGRERERERGWRDIYA